MTVLYMSHQQGLADGEYTAVFAGAEAGANEHGPSLVWRWQVMDGPQAGRKAQLTTGQQPTPRNKCGRVVEWLAGRALGDGEPFDPAGYGGRAYRIQVRRGVVEHAAPAQPGPQQAAYQPQPVPGHQQQPAAPPAWQQPAEAQPRPSPGGPADPPHPPGQPLDPRRYMRG